MAIVEKLRFGMKMFDSYWTAHAIYSVSANITHSVLSGIALSWKS